MIAALSFILWEARPEIWPDGPVPLRWYGLMFAAAFALGQYVISYIFKRDGKPEKDVDSLTYHMILGTVLGARLGHCLFYQPDYYLSHPIEILKVWEGGLASHGATIGIIFAMWLYSRKHPNQSWLWILDRIVIVVALGGAFIRFGNLMNSEIIGKPADQPWSMVFLQPFETFLRDSESGKIEHFSFTKQEGETVLDNKTYKKLSLKIVFKPNGIDVIQAETFASLALPAFISNSNGDEEHLRLIPGQKPKIYTNNAGQTVLEMDMLGLPRHPAMVYESISNFLLFIFLFMMWKKNKELPEGMLFSLFVIVLFSLRFFYEFLKENQVDFEDGLALNMGQNLSIPMVLVGLFLLWRSLKPTEKKIN
jgi:prolipoprotein diacylglyceryltransferase